MGACAGEEENGGTEPTPSPTEPFPADRCEILWINSAEGERIDFFRLSGAVAAWVTGSSHGYALSAEDGFVGTYVRGYDLDDGTFDLQAVVTSGTFALTVPAVTAGASIAFADSSAQPVYLLDTAGSPSVPSGTSGTGTFTGVWSDPYSSDVVPGDGSFRIVILGTATVLGEDLTYATCAQDEEDE